MTTRTRSTNVNAVTTPGTSTFHSNSAVLLFHAITSRPAQLTTMGRPAEAPATPVTGDL